MTSARVTDAARRAVYDIRRYEMSAEIGDLSDLGTRPWADLRDIELFPGSRLGDPTIEIPESWLPAGLSRRRSFRTLDPAEAGVEKNVDPRSAARRDENIRRALLALWLPHRTETGPRSYKPGSWRSAARLLLRVGAWQAEHRPSNRGTVFTHLTAGDLLEMQLAVGSHSRQIDNLRSLMRILIDAGRRGLIVDYPRIFESDGEHVDRSTLERSYKGKTRIAPAPKIEERNWQPFPDEFVTEIIRRALWIHEHLAERLIDCWNGVRAIGIDAERVGRNSSHPSVIAGRNDFIDSFAWIDAAGTPIRSLPFPLKVIVNGESTLTYQWPQTGARFLSSVVGALQALNLCTVLFCTGARSSEVADARDDALGVPSENRLHSRTFKIVDSVKGVPRDWPLHPAAARAIEVQRKLAKSVRPPHQDHLWVMIRHGYDGGPQLNLTEPLVNAVELLGLTALAGTDRPHAHRWRHTVARLVALSVVGAPQVLLDLFGHRDLEMTLRYMLADPQIVEDAMKVAHETAFALAEEAIRETLLGETSGMAAGPLRNGLERLGMRHGADAFGTSSLRETAEILTFNGRVWQMTRPGVLCTKALGEFGRCKEGNCRPECGNRLELARAKRDCEETLHILLREHEVAAAQGAEMLLASIEGQILSHLKRWSDVRARLMAENATAKAIWNGGNA
jgi:GAF domain-containing protein